MKVASPGDLMNSVRWGIMGTGRMAAIMARELGSLRAEGVELVAVASRQADRARAFAESHAIARAWGTYSALTADSAVDIVYVATRHTCHYENMLACLRAGKAVLCEKPFTINAREAMQVIEAARSARRFVMEAMWTRFVPGVVALREQLASGVIGRVRMIIGGGAFVPDPASNPYILDQQLGGGALLDAGIYLVSMTSMILGAPSRIQASGLIGKHGVDEQDAIVLEHPDGAAALLYISLQARRAPDLEILGESGRIRIAAPLFNPPKLTIFAQDASERTVEFPRAGTGYGHQVREVMAALRAERRESGLMPLNETLSIMQTMDRIRAEIGLRYPGEN